MKKKLFIQKDQRDQKIISKKSLPKVPKICHIITGLERGGAERFLFNLLTATDVNKKNNNMILFILDLLYH